MINKPFDLDNLVEAGAGTWVEAPDGMRIGHVHLRVGDIEQAEQFYRGVIGLEITLRGGGASFMSSGRYHHHIGSNVWNSAGAGRREADRAGLSWFSFEAADDDVYEALVARLSQAGAIVRRTTSAVETLDPWGTRVRVTRT
jgi:catechol 2,3-dioxygenase